jgi:hypothetical protein
MTHKNQMANIKIKNGRTKKLNVWQKLNKIKNVWTKMLNDRDKIKNGSTKKLNTWTKSEMADTK